MSSNDAEIHRHFSIRRRKVKACGTTELGTTPSQLVKGSKVFGFDADALKYEDIDDLIQALKCGNPHSIA